MFNTNSTKSKKMENQINLLKVDKINLEIKGWSLNEDLSSQYFTLNINGNVTNEYIELSHKVKENSRVGKITLENEKTILTFENTSFNNLSINSSYEENQIGDFSIMLFYSKLKIEIKK